MKIKLTMLLGLSVLLLAGCDINETMREKSSVGKEAMDARTIAASNGCMGCHAVSNLIVGPAWKTVAQYYVDNPNAEKILVAKIKSGGKGTWDRETKGESMPGFEGKLSDEDISLVVKYILSLSE